MTIQSNTGLLTSGRVAAGVSLSNKDPEMAGISTHSPCSGWFTRTVQRHPRSGSQQLYSACHVRTPLCRISRSLGRRANAMFKAEFHRYTAV